MHIALKTCMVKYDQTHTHGHTEAENEKQREMLWLKRKQCKLNKILLSSQNIHSSCRLDHDTLFGLRGALRRVGKLKRFDLTISKTVSSL